MLTMFDYRVAWDEEMAFRTGVSGSDFRTRRTGNHGLTKDMNLT